jgi:hypothetical protein
MTETVCAHTDVSPIAEEQTALFRAIETAKRMVKTIVVKTTIFCGEFPYARKS